MLAIPEMRVRRELRVDHRIAGNEVKTFSKCGSRFHSESRPHDRLLKLILPQREIHFDGRRELRAGKYLTSDCDPR